MKIKKDSLKWLFLGFAPIFSCQTYIPGSFDNNQIQPDSVCWSVDISNGIDESNTTEFKALFDCLNQSDAFTSLQPLILHWISPSSGPTPLAIPISQSFNELNNLDYDLIEILDATYNLIHVHPDLIQQTESLIVELIYAAERESPPPSLSDQTSIDNGLVIEAIELSHLIGSHLVNNPDSIDASINWELTPLINDMTCSTISIDEQFESENSTIHLDLIEFLEAPLNNNNDQWIGATDDSLQNWMTTVTENNSSIVYELQPTIHTLISDERVQNELQELLEQQQLTSNLDAFPNSLHYLLSVDKNGGILNDDEKSAFYHIMDIMEQTNQPLECGFEILDVPITTIEIDNLAVQLLTRLADTDNNEIADALDLLYILDLGIAQFTLERIINSEVCPLLNQELLENMVALERLNDEPAQPLFELGIDAIRRLKSNDDEQNKLYEIADLISIIHSNNLTEPTEELLRDLLPTNLMNEIIDVIPHLLQPPIRSTYCPEESKTLSFKELLSLTSEFINPDNRHLYDVIILIERVLNEDVIWKARPKIVTYLSYETMVLMNPLSYLRHYLEYDPNMQILAGVGTLYGNDTIRTTGLLIVTDPLTQSIVKSSNEETPGPLSLLGKWIYSNTLDDVILLLKWVLSPLYETNQD